MEFISYASDYDLYEGQRDIGQLPTDQQDALINAILGVDEHEDFRALTVDWNVKKSRWKAYGLFVFSSGFAWSALESSKTLTVEPVRISRRSFPFS
jgi:hypothetical protein